MTKELICWDSSVLIDWIRGDNISRMNVIRPVAQSIARGDYLLVVSVLAYPEVLERRMPEGSIEKLSNFLENSEDVETIAVDKFIAEKAQTIRNHTLRKTSDTAKTRTMPNPLIATPDAIHLATAIVSGAKLFHTFDKKLLSLNGKDEVENLVITPCTIHGVSGSLFNNGH